MYHRLVIVSSTVFACHSAACAPPSAGGTGGSLDGGKAGVSHQIRGGRVVVGGKAITTTLRKDGSMWRGTMVGAQFKRTGLKGKKIAETVYGSTRAEAARMAVKKHQQHLDAVAAVKAPASPKPATKPKAAPAPQDDVPQPKTQVKPAAAAPSGPRKPVSTETLVKVIKGTQVTDDFVDNATSSQQEKQALKDMMTTLKATGAATGKPRTVSPAEFERLAKSDPSAVIARSAPPQAHRELVESPSIQLRQGAAQYGEGLYFAGGKGAADHVERNYGGGRNTTMRAVVDRSSLVDINFLKDVTVAARQVLGGGKPKGSRDVLEAARVIAHAYKQSGARLTKPEFGESHGFSDVLYNPAVLAPLLGFKGFTVSSPMLNGRKQPVDYIVILDRSALTVPE